MSVLVALVAAAEIDQMVFQETGSLVPTSQAWSSAQFYVSLNTSGLSGKGVRAYVTGIHITPHGNRVRVSVSADLSVLFPAFVPKVQVTRIGVAALRALAY